MCGTGSFRNTYNSAAPYQTRYTAAGSPIFSDYGPEGTTEFGCVTLSAVPESGKASVYEYSLAGGYLDTGHMMVHSRWNILALWWHW